MQERVIPSDLTAAKELEEQVLRELDRHGYSEVASFAVRLAMEEGLNNAIKHGNRRDQSKTVTVCYEVTAEEARITIQDEGPGFHPEDVPDPTADENLEKPCGRGIMLMHAYMDDVHYNDRGNKVFLVKRNT